MAKASPAILSVRVNPAERAMVEAAEQDLLEQRQVVIPVEDWERFEAWVHAEPRQIEALRKLATSRPAWEG